MRLSQTPPYPFVAGCEPVRSVVRLGDKLGPGSTVTAVLFTVHVLTGAAIGAAVRRPLLAFPLGVVSHVAVDAVPHWAVAADPRTWMTVAVVDGVVGCLLLLVVTVLAPSTRRAGVLAGAAGAVLLDLDKPARMLLGVDLYPQWVDVIHSGVQSEALNRWWVDGLAGALAGVTAWAVLRAPRRRAGSGSTVDAAPEAGRAAEIADQP